VILDGDPREPALSASGRRCREGHHRSITRRGARLRNGLSPAHVGWCDAQLATLDHTARVLGGACALVSGGQ
jgi:hypothetical protein